MLSLAARVELEQGKLIRVMGPASISVETGRVRILGIDFGPGKRIVIHRYRSYAVKALEKSTISVVLGEGGGIEEPAEGEEVIDEWERAANSIVDSKGIAVVIGPVDSGKTSFSLLVANIAISRGLKPAIVDADVGQGDLAPPGFIAMKVLEDQLLWLRETRGDVIRLIGSITPTHAFAASRLIAAIRELVDTAMQRNAMPIVVNTDGWVTGYPAIDMKLNIVKTAGATHVVVLDDVLCAKVKRAIGASIDVICVPRPRVVRERDRADRRFLRRQHYQSFFQKAKRICLELSSIALLNACISSGFPWPAEEVGKIAQELGVKIYSLIEHDDALVILSDSERLDFQRLREIFQQKEVYIVTRNSVKGLLAAVLNRRLEELAPALIESVDPETGKICILTEYEGEIAGIAISRIKLNEEWEETGRIVKCPL